MQAQSSHLSHGQFFAFSGIKLCEVFCSSPIIPQLTHCFIAYKDDSTTIDTLLKQLKQQQKDKLKTLNSTQILRFSIGNFLLKKQMTIRELRSLLHNYQAAILKFDLVVNVSSSLGLQCSVVTEVLENHPLYKQISANENRIEICIELPQLSKVYYYSMNATKTLKSEIDEFNRLTKIKKQWPFKVQSYVVKCKKCKKVIQKSKLQQPTFKHFQSHFTIQLTFTNIIDNKNQKKQNPSQDVEIIIKRSNIDEKPLYQVRYGEVKKKKVISILENCQNIQQYYNLGLRIGEKILKPYQYLSTINDLAAMKGGKIDAFLVDGSQIFYNITHRFQNDSFNLEQVIKDSKETKKKEFQEKIRNQRSRIINSELNETFRNSEFLDPILGYTSPLYFKELNTYLRDTILGWLKDQELNNNLYFKLAVALIKSLLCLPNHNGITYRGTELLLAKFMKQGQIICFQSFTSTSRSQMKAKSFRKNVFFIIHCLTGKSISKYSLYPQDEVLIMPYSYFQVLSITTCNNDEYYQIQLQQIPIPRRKDHNILLWVDDNPGEGFKMYEKIYRKYPNMRAEFIHLLSNDSLKEWIQKFNYLIDYTNKISVITDMKRGSDNDEGIKTIQIVRKYIPNTNIMVFINHKVYTLELMESRGIKQSETLIVSDSIQEVQIFIEQMVLIPRQIECSQCLCM